MENAGKSEEEREHAQYILSRTFDSLFVILQNQINLYTSNINEYVYLYNFLYPHYIEPLTNATLEKQQELLEKPLLNKAFKDLVKEVLTSSLFMHLKSKSDIEHAIEEADEKDFNERVKTGQAAAITQVGNEILQKKEGFDYKRINYLETYKNEQNFTFLQSLCLIAAFLAGSNKEAMDSRIFTR